MDFDIIEDKNLKIISFKNDEETKKELENLMFLEYNVKKGDKLKQGDKLMTIETMKGTNEVESMVSGVVEELNNKLIDNLDLLKQKPDTWLIRLR